LGSIFLIGKDRCLLMYSKTPLYQTLLGSIFLFGKDRCMIDSVNYLCSVHGFRIHCILLDFLSNLV
jgi:hypothetical protein